MVMRYEKFFSVHGVDLLESTREALEKYRDIEDTYSLMDEYNRFC
jgi:hypothetical protein